MFSYLPFLCVYVDNDPRGFVKASKQGAKMCKSSRPWCKVHVKENLFESQEERTKTTTRISTQVGVEYPVHSDVTVEVYFQH